MQAVMILATVAITIGLALFFGITTGYLAIVAILRLFAGRSSTPEKAPVLAPVAVPSQPGR